MTASARRLYVYYRVAAEDVPAVAEAVLRMQAGLQQAWPGLEASLSRRPESKDGLATLMEVYAHPALASDGRVARAIELAASAALAPWLRSPRHPETFDEL